jgi:hypothetical protein
VAENSEWWSLGYPWFHMLVAHLGLLLHGKVDLSTYEFQFKAKPSSLCLTWTNFGRLELSQKSTSIAGRWCKIGFGPHTDCNVGFVCPRSVSSLRSGVRVGTSHHHRLPFCEKSLSSAWQHPHLIYLHSVLVEQAVHLSFTVFPYWNEMAELLPLTAERNTCNLSPPLIASPTVHIVISLCFQKNLEILLFDLPLTPQSHTSF